MKQLIYYGNNCCSHHPPELEDVNMLRDVNAWGNVNAYNLLIARIAEFRIYIGGHKKMQNWLNAMQYIAFTFYIGGRCIKRSVEGAKLVTAHYGTVCLKL